MKKKLNKTMPDLQRRAIFAFCDESNSALFQKITSLFNSFIQTNDHGLYDASLAKWAGDVHKFGVHITLRGVCTIQNDDASDWLDAICKVTRQFPAIRLEKSRLFFGFPKRIAIVFEGPEHALSCLARLAFQLAKAVKPLVRWTPISRFEIDEMYSLLHASSLTFHKKLEILNILDEISFDDENHRLRPLPEAPEYRLRALVPIWEDEAAKEALFEFGDTNIFDLIPHISLLSAFDSMEDIGLITSKFSDFMDESAYIDTIYAMVEKPSSLVLVDEIDIFGGKTKAYRPQWEIEAAFPLAGDFNTWNKKDA